MRKITLTIISILILICSVCLIYENINKENKTNEGMFAIFLEQEKDTGKYQRSNLKTWPTEEEYAINMQKTYCENGSVLRWNLETKKINVTVKGTDKCYVYFDKSEYGTQEHPHLIQTIEDLVRLSNNVNSGTTYAGEYFLLTNDLDFNDPSDYEDSERLDFNDINGINGNEALIIELTTGSGFVPIGKNVGFNGNFNGNNKKIMNLYINDTIARVNPSKTNGLFGNIVNSTIQNLTVTGNVTTKYEENMGGIIGVATNSTIKNCHNEANVVSEAGTWSTGGVLGTPYGKVDIINCSNSGDVTGGSWIGGVVGGVGSGSILTIENCSNSGKVQKIDAVHYVGVGGLVGAAIDPNESEKITISNSHNEGTVFINLNNSGISPVGGIIGRSDANTIINNCSNTGVIDTENDNNAIIGGIIGFSNSTLEINDCHNKGKINSSNAKHIGGILGSDNIVDNETKITNSFNAGEIIIDEEIPENETINDVGGLIGFIKGNVNIDNCHNNATLKSVGLSYVGGIVGRFEGYTVTNSSITNSHNEGNIWGHIIGGLVAQVVYYKSLIIDNCYNYGKLSSYSSTKSLEVGGLVAHNSGSSELIIINSANIGELELILSAGPWPVAGGIFGTSNWNSQIYVINSYSVGTINSQVSTYGIGTVVDNAGNGETKIYTNNVFHLGKIASPYLAGTIPDLEGSTVKYQIINTYNDDANSTGKNKEAIDVTGDFMKSQKFVDSLNSNIVDETTLKDTKTNEITTLEEINSVLKDYTLSKWQLGSNGYPELINK